LLDTQGQPYVTDFGLAKRLQQDAALTQSGAIVGTPSSLTDEERERFEIARQVQ